MKKLTILLLPRYAKFVFTCNATELIFKKNTSGYYESTYESENDEVDIKIDTLPSELVEKHWGCYFLGAFLVSIFSIFNPPYPKRDLFVLHYVGKINMKDNPTITIAFANPLKDGKALLLKDEVSQLYFSDNASNVYRLDIKAKKRRSLIIFLRVMMIILFIIGFIVLTILFTI